MICQFELYRKLPRSNPEVRVYRAAKLK